MKRTGDVASRMVRPVVHARGGVTLQMWQYRSAGDEEDLEALFRLRFRAFSASDTLHEVVAGCSQEIDVSPWDLLSDHYGIFEDGVPVAAIRAVGGEPTLQSGCVKAVAERLGLAQPDHPALPYPMLGQFASPPLIAKVASQRDQGLRVVECGRLCIAPELDAATSRRAFRFLAECTLAAELLAGRTDVMYGLSPPKLASIYRAYGFERVKQVNDIVVFSTHVRGVLSVVTREQMLGQRLLPRLRRYSDELKGSGSVRNGERLLNDVP